MHEKTTNGKLELATWVSLMYVFSIHLQSKLEDILKYVIELKHWWNTIEKRKKIA
jgi:hypothetical protein